MIESSITIRVRYGECDPMGIVYYGNYFLYYENARTEMMRSIGLSYKAMEAKGIMLPVHSADIQYKKPAYYDDLITVKCFMDEIPTTKLVFRYELFNEKLELLNRGKTTLVYVDALTRKPSRAPNYFLDVILPYFI